MSATMTRTVSELERITSNLSDGQIANLRHSDLEAWHFCIDEGHRARLIAAENAREERERQERLAAKKKPEPKAAAQPAPAERGAGFVRFRNLQKFAGSVGRLIREQRAEATQELTGKLASAARVSELNQQLEQRVRQLEERQAKGEQRISNLDSRYAGQAKHLQILDEKIFRVKTKLEEGGAQ